MGLLSHVPPTKRRTTSARLSTTESLLKRSDLPAATQGELLLIQGKSEEATGATGKAMKTYEPLLKNFDTAYGA